MSTYLETITFLESMDIFWKWGKKKIEGHFRKIFSENGDIIGNERHFKWGILGLG